MALYKCSGKTFNAKEDLKLLGFRWDGINKCWAGDVVDSKLEDVKKLAMRHNFIVYKNGIIVFGDEKELPESE